MSEPLHPLIRGLRRAAEVAPATARRLDPADSPIRRFESSIDRLLLVSESTRIESLTRSPTGEPALARELAAIEARPAASSADAPGRVAPGSRAPWKHDEPALGPRSIPPISPARIAETTRRLAADRIAEPGISAAPTARATATRSLAARRVVLHSFERPVAPSNLPLTPVSLSREQAARELRARIEASSAPIAAWTSTIPAHPPSEPASNAAAVEAVEPPSTARESVPGVSGLKSTGDIARGSATPRVAVRGDSNSSPAGDRLEMVLRRLASGVTDPPMKQTAPSPLRSETLAPFPPSIPVVTPATSSSSFPVPPPNEPPLTGLRGLAALGERLDSEPAPRIRSSGDTAASATALPPFAHGPRGPAPLPAEPRDLASALANLLRQEALRHGIDPREGLA